MSTERVSDLAELQDRSNSYVVCRAVEAYLRDRGRATPGPIRGGDERRAASRDDES